jgi:DoxX-like family
MGWNEQMKLNASYLTRKLLTIGIAAIWLINGLFCKVLNLVPRHQRIVARILGESHAAFETKAIGILEIAMSVWILSRIKPRLCAFTQVLVIGTMNMIEFILAPDLLLFGRLNIIIASTFIVIILCNEFYAKKPSFRR